MNNHFVIISLLLVAVANSQMLFSNVCQSGIREDNTNYIYCARRGLNEIPLFSKNNVVYDELVLSDNRITELNSDSFARIKVKKIFLNGNPLKRIDQATFAKLENHLEELWLDADTTISSNNYLIEPASSNGGIPKAILNYLRNLNTLKLKGFMIKRLENYLFKKLNRIEILSLQFCSIEQIDPFAFDGLKNSLKELHLDGNLLQQIPTSSLLSIGFRALRVLSLSQNNIKTIGVDSFDLVPFENPLRNLVKLDISYNGLRVIDPQAFAVFNSSLDTLYLQNNEINSFNLKFLRELTALTELNLDFNVINKLSSNIFVNSNKLHYLTLQGNSVQFDEEEEAESESVFSGLTSLQRLNLARNGVKYLPRNLFKPLTSLKSLILDKNPIDHYDAHSFSGLETSLMNISLQNTKLKSKYLVSLKNLTRLERVKLGFNELDELDWSIFAQTHESLINLDLQNNQINAIYHSNCDLDSNSSSDCVKQMENLIELDLSNNKLCTFNSNLLARFPKLKNLGLAQNPLYCDCSLLSLYEWTKRKFEKDMLSFIQWQCELPAENNNNDYNNKKQQRKRQFTSLSPSDFKCTLSPRCKSTNSKFILTTNATSTTSTTTTSTTTEKIISRITNVNLKSVSNSILVQWELNNSDKSTDDLQGFKVSYNLLDQQQSTQQSPILVSFLTDKNQRTFKIDNLRLGAHYSVCVSVLRQDHNNGYDKYCRDLELLLLKSLPEKLKPQQQASASTLVTSSSSPAIVNIPNSNLISGLMITVLSLLVSFLLGLLVFFYFFIRKCRNNQKRKMLRGQAKKRDYTGAILASTNQFDLKKDLKSDYCSSCTSSSHQKCESETCSSASSSSNTSSPQSSICNCIRTGLNTAGCSTLARAFTIGDTSTVSSTLSSLNNNNTNLNSKNQLIGTQTCGRVIKANTLGQQQQPNMATAVVMTNGLPSPNSFTHYIIQQYNNNANNPQQQLQAQPVSLSYVPYEIYNCYAKNTNQFNPQQQQQQFIPHLINNSKTLSELNHLVPDNSNNNNASNIEHVYCEIPSSTLCRPAATLNNAKIFFYDQMKLNQQNVNQQQFFSNCSGMSNQNASTSLLISSSALSSTLNSSKTNSPTQLITSSNNSNKFANNVASVI